MSGILIRGVLLFLAAILLAFSPQPSCSGQFCLSKVETYNAGPAHTGFADSAFDGRYVYFGPNFNSSGFHATAGRYDTAQSFNDPASWTYFDFSKVTGLKGSSVGLVTLDGHVYFAPFVAMTDGTIKGHSKVARFKAGGAFDDPQFWKSADLWSLIKHDGGFIGAATDGKFVYFIPYFGQARVVRYDPSRDFSDPAGWTAFDLQTLGSRYRGYVGAVFDGRYLYLGPCNDQKVAHGRMLRYDTQNPFDDPSSWSAFTATTIHPELTGFDGVVFYGRYVYYVPFYRSKMTDDRHGRVARFDTHNAFDHPESWSHFDMVSKHPNAKGYIGGGFDGRYVYFSPKMNAVGQNRIVMRYDTKGEFLKPEAWDFLDVGTGEFDGTMSFDGKYLYLVPNGTSAPPIHGKFIRFTP